MTDILVVDSSRLISKRLERSIREDGEYNVAIAHSHEQAREIIENDSESFFAAVVNFEMPGAEKGELVDMTVASGISTIVLTESLDSEVRDAVLAKDVVDYYLKEEPSIDAITTKLRRLKRNLDTKILVVDDSSTFRKITGKLLRSQRFSPLEAEDGRQALTVLEANPDTTLVITDYEMPGMNGNELVHLVREKWSRDEMGIIGVSSLGSSAMSAMFLKAGADDFLTKPYQNEEFNCRVYRSIEAVENIQAIKRAAYTDNLTGLHNRLFFFKEAPGVFESAKKEKKALAVAMIDIDKFKSINDTYGHAGGDVALRHLGGLLERNLRDASVVARFGGEEFCVLAEGLDKEGASELFEGIRRDTEESSVEFAGQVISFTLSIGVETRPGDSLDATINAADLLLYEAKNSGRNQVRL